VRAARILFRQNSATGSFDAPSASGSTATPGGGLQAQRLFNPDGTLLVSGGSTSTAWPTWITRAEVGISGSSNSGATDSACVRFSNAAESTATCALGADSAQTTLCGAPSGLLRVSETDCLRAPPTVGNGGPNDGIYIRVSLDPTKILSGENVLAVLEYAAYSFLPGSSSPQNCFVAGAFTPTAPGCADMVWNVYLKRNSFEIPQPFLMLVPPAQGTLAPDSAYTAAVQTGLAGRGIATKSFILPLAQTQYRELQISRVSALANSTTDLDTQRSELGPAGTGATDLARTLNNICNGSAATAASPLCFGMVLYSLTLYRI